MTQESVLLAATALTVGVAVGVMGIGGVLLAPMLIYVGGIDPHRAVATSLYAFIFTGVAGTIAHGAQGHLPWRPVGFMTLGIVPAALVGAASSVRLPETALELALACVVAISGAHALRRRRGRNQQGRFPSGALLVVVGFGVGFGSALTGTGGPVLLVPALLALGVPALPSVAASQVIQLPVALAGTTAFALQGQVDFELGAVLGTLTALGAVAGARMAPRIPAGRLQSLIGSSLLVVAALVATLALTGH